ncbi:hypothetical protein GE061_014496 [Apolygus lucorum]|uniref:Uncharacterized protein n=1 Tax=Apolygus lucorum TaxID=248454 RepID=A0A8S9XIF6_APOLU|nr:hypothetical protein GE061_014496 [Apolygus lucorum]
MDNTDVFTSISQSVQLIPKYELQLHLERLPRISTPSTMSRPGASWWPDDVVEELPGNSPKRCRVEEKQDRTNEPSLADLLDKKRGSVKADDSDDIPEHPETAESTPTAESGTSAQPSADEKSKDDIWVVRKVSEENSEDEEGQKSGDEDEEAERPNTPVVPIHHHLPGSFEEHFENMCLHEAAEKRMFSAVFRSKDDIDHVNEFGETALHFAAEIGATSIAALLIDRGADPNVVDDDGFTPLLIASSFGHSEIVEILLEGGAEINTPDDLLMAPLHHAAHGGFDDLVKVLLDHGADPYQEDLDGHMPCDFAFHGGHLQLAEYLFEILDGPHREDRRTIHADAA